jgi:hypothetical protein
MRWISAKALDTWADTQIGRAEVARLVGRLIWATAKTLRSFRFPAGEAGEIPGFDGHLIADPEFVQPFVPGGESVWEFGTDKNYVKKANDVYEDRTNKPGLIDSSKSTFVFVTPRIWKRPRGPTLVDWEKQKQAERKWAHVLAIDAVKLETWLEQHAAVAKDFAREVTGLAQVDGVRSLGEFWQDYAEQFDPRLAEGVLLCARQKEAEELITRLVAGVPQAIRLQADSRDEVVAFATAAIRKADPSVREFLEGRTLVLDTSEAVAQTTNFSGMVFLPRDTAVDLAGSLSYRVPTIIPLARVDNSATPLSRPTWYEIYQALKEMVPEDERAERLARECGRSVTILARRIPRVLRPSPPWSSTPGLLAALMAGAWDDSVEADRIALATLTSGTYEEFEREMRALLSLPEPLEREGSVWKIRAPVDTFIELGPHITAQDLDRLRSVASTVFAEVEPSLDLPVKERPYAAFKGKRMGHSDWLRDGLATTLLQIAVLHEQARLDVTGIVPQKFVDDLIRDLQGLKQDARLLISLGRQLPWLMEAAPRPLLDALEHLLEGDGSGIIQIFEEGESLSLFPTSYHTHLLWALETLAWDPAFLNRASLDLAMLARLDPGGKLANRPIESLIKIFKPWMPQTKASLIQRLAAVDFITAKEPKVGWELILSLLPARQGFSTPNPRPRLRDIGVAREEELTNGIVYQTYGEAVDRAIRLAQGNPDRVLTMLRAMDAFRQEDMNRVCDELERVLPIVSDDRRLNLGNELRALVSMHATHAEAQWAFPPAIVDRLRALQQRMEPRDPILRIQWLFDKHFPDLDNAAGSGSERVAAVDRARSAAIRDLYAQMGDLGVVELARRAKFPGLVGAACSELFEGPVGFDRLITTAYAVENMPDLFPMALSGIAHAKFGEDWAQMVADRARNGLAPDRVASLILGWSEERTAWNWAERLGSEVVQSYWSRRLAFPVRGDLADLERAAKEYLKAGRALAAVQALGDATKALSGELVFRILDVAVTEIAEAQSQIDTNLAFEIGQIFDNLAARDDISETDLARREYTYLPLLEHRSNTLTLHRLMLKDPEFFVAVLCDVFKPGSGEMEEPTDERKGRARQGYALLSSLTLVPGFGNETNADVLRKWVGDVRLLAAKQDRAKIADQFIGQVLAHSPVDPTDNAWPHQLVRDLIEKLKSDEVEVGIQTGRYNLGGAHAIDPKFPAALERHLAAEARAWANIAFRWPRTVTMLNSMAEHWEWLAEVLEQRHRQEAMRD